MSKNSEPAPTFEEFCAEAEKRFEPAAEIMRKKIPGLPANEYIKTKDAQETLKNAYERSLKKYSEGTLSREIFLGDCVSGTVYCLYLMYPD